MTRAIGVVMLGLGVLFVAASMRMNYFAGLRLGETPEEGQVFAWLAAAVAGANAGLPFTIGWGARRSEWGVVIVATLLLVLFLLYSLCSALGYAAGNRGAAVGGREAISADFDAAQKHEKDLRSRLATVANVRPAAVIEAEIARQRQDRLWMMSSECREATGATSRAFCKGVETLRAELAAAGEASGLRLELARVTAELATLRGKGAGLDADPQIASLSRLFGFSRERVTSAWSALFSVLTELGCAFVPFIGLTMLGVRHAPSSGASGGDSATIVGQGPGRGPALKKRKSWKWLGRRMTGLLELPPLRSVEFSEDGRVRITDQQ